MITDLQSGDSNRKHTRWNMARPKVRRAAGIGTYRYPTLQFVPSLKGLGLH